MVTLSKQPGRSILATVFLATLLGLLGLVVIPVSWPVGWHVEMVAALKRLAKGRLSLQVQSSSPEVCNVLASQAPGVMVRPYYGN